LTISVPEQQEDAHDKHAEAVSQLPRSARAEHLAQNQAQVERADMHQLPLQNVLPSPQMAAPQAAEDRAVSIPPVPKCSIKGDHGFIGNLV